LAIVTEVEVVLFVGRQSFLSQVVDGQVVDGQLERIERRVGELCGVVDPFMPSANRPNTTPQTPPHTNLSYG